MNCDKKTAEITAVKEYLECCMNMSEEEIEQIGIYKTKHSKSKNILYIQTDADTVVDLFRRGSKAKNREYQLVNFKRNSKLLRICF